MNVDLIAITKPLCVQPQFDSPEHIIVKAGRICYGGSIVDTVNPGNFIRQRIKAGHESILEHASATFEISGISRACSHQLVRHRLASYSQESQRYVDMSDPEVVVPDAIVDNPDAFTIWSRFMEQVKETYQDLRALGVRKEDARFALPNAAATRIVVTMNFRELRHFFRLRLAKDAQWEIRQLAGAMLHLVKKQAPNVFEDIQEEE